MHNLVSFNHQILPARETNLSAISSGTFYGKGVFTTVAIYHGRPCLWEKHWRRLTGNAKKLGLDLSDFSAASVKSSLLEIIERNSVVRGRARLTLVDEKPSRIWSFESEKRTSLLITTGEFRKVADDLKLTVSPFRINSASPLANIKSCNYLDHLLTLEEANQRGFEEAIRLNERNEITAACLANIFWLKDQNIYTPSLKTGCLAGTLRELLLENFEVFEVETTLEDLQQADQIFLTSSGIEMVKAARFEAKIFNFSDKFSKLQSGVLKLLKSFSEIEPVS